MGNKRGKGKQATRSMIDHHKGAPGSWLHTRPFTAEIERPDANPGVDPRVIKRLERLGHKVTLETSAA
jgi:hypothetical protein